MPRYLTANGREVVADLLDNNLNFLELSVRTTNTLESGYTHCHPDHDKDRCSSKTIRDLIGYSAEELLEIRNFGKGSLKEVVSALEKHELKLRDPNSPKDGPVQTVKVRIAVAVQDDGNWHAYGDPHETDAESQELSCNYLGNRPVKVYFVEAELPIPAPETIQSRVTPV